MIEVFIIGGAVLALLPFAKFAKSMGELDKK